MRRSGIPTIESIKSPPPPEPPDLRPFRRMMFFLAAVIGFSLLIAAQFVRWQIIERDILVEGLAARGGYYEEIPSQRGLIVDRNQNLLALNNYDFGIEAAPNMIPDRQTQEVAEQLAPLLEMSQNELFSILDGDALYAQVARHVPRNVGKAVIALGIKGIFVRPIAVRIYPEDELGAHVLGFVAGDAEQGSKGYYGVEGFYDKALKGKTGVRDEAWDPWTRPVAFADRRAYGWTLPQEGRTLVLTIDRTIQFLLEQELRAAIERYGAESGCIVVMNPKTGALIAAATYPTYDPNRFAETEEALFVNPVVGRQYEPGSTFKVITFAAALDTGTIQPTDLYQDLGYIEVGGRIIKNWDERNYGTVSMTDVLIKSLNTGAAHISTLLGANVFYNYVTRFGFGHEIGIDMEGEVAGQVRQPGDAEWHESDLGTNAFGQGLAVTPLQLVTAVSAVANRGFMMQPYVVEQLIRDDQVAAVKHVTVRQVISERTARILTEMMVRVVEDGVAQAQVPGYRIAGKSGTAQVPIVGGYDPNLTIASFIGFAPADDPQFVALVRLDKPTQSLWGSSTAAPTFANVARILFTQLAIPPDPAQLAKGGQ
ncbi:MAG: penicillin-binding protein 2 [Anaerolineae bacterium]|nr:penicillin-binding protein 2 [Anaerolineae bacterium]